MDSTETPAAKAADAAAPQMELIDIFALVIENLLTLEEIVLAQTDLCCLLLPKNRGVTYHPSGFFLKGSVHCK